MSDLIKDLETQLAEATDTRQRIDLLNKLAWELRDNDLRRAIALSQEALELCDRGAFAKQPYHQGIAESQHNLGRFHAQLGNYEASLSLLFEALPLFEASGNKSGKARVLNGMGNTHLFVGDYADALNAYLEALRIFETIGDQELQAGLLNNIGYLNLELGAPEKALGFLERSLEISKETGNKKLQADSLDSSCKAYCDLGASDKALQCGLQSVELYQDVNSRHGEARAFDSVGYAYQGQGDLDRALEYYQAALQISLEINLRFETVEAHLRLGSVYHQQGHMDEALSHLNQALAIAENIDARHKLYECHLELSEVHKQTGDYSVALEHYKRFHVLKEQVFNDRTDRRLQNLEVAHQVETTKKEAEIYQLRYVALQEEIDIRQEVESALRATNRQLQQTITAHEEAIAELNTFAHMVAHDLKNPLQIITAGSQYLSLKLRKSLDEKTSEVLQAIESTSIKMGRIIDELLILASVRRQEVTSYPLDMAKVIREAERRLAHAIFDQQVEIIKPSTWPRALGYAPWIEEVWDNYMSNAIKYGGHPPRLELGATPLENGKIRFWIKDNGNGLDPAAQAEVYKEFARVNSVRLQGQGLGLSIVKRIIEKLGGEVAVESPGVPGQGCTFSFTLPAARKGT